MGKNTCHTSLGPKSHPQNSCKSRHLCTCLSLKCSHTNMGGRDRSTFGSFGTWQFEVKSGEQQRYHNHISNKLKGEDQHNRLSSNSYTHSLVCIYLQKKKNMVWGNLFSLINQIYVLKILKFKDI